MEQYYSWGGAQNPDFRYKVKVKEATDPMLHWCSVYPAKGSFERYFIRWIREDEYRAEFQFETEAPALLFKIKFGDS